MFARARDKVFIRDENFGSSVYVADRDDIFLLDLKATKLVKNLTNRWKSVTSIDTRAATRLAEVGVLEAKKDLGSNSIAQRGFSGTHTFGEFRDIPLVGLPLLVNCFSTAWCPLKCVYCHADDLMDAGLRANETFDGITNVVATANKIPALVYVITGGDPLSRPKRAVHFAENIRDDVGVVVDTSGAGRVSDAVELFETRPMHLRVSIDSMDPRVNKKTRPVNSKLRAELGLGKHESLDMAEQLIGEVGPLATGVTVQTVVSSKNDTFEHLFQLRDWLISRGVTNWVLHLAVNAGAARRFSSRSPEEKKWLNRQVAGHSISLKKSVSILPDRESASKIIRDLLSSTLPNHSTMDIRCTDGNTSPNSVFLIGSEGDLYTQGRGADGGRKVQLFSSDGIPTEMQSLWTYVSNIDHVQRYINYFPKVNGNKPIGELLW